MTSRSLVTFLVTQSYLFTERHYDCDEADTEARSHEHKLTYDETLVPHATIIPVNKQTKLYASDIRPNYLQVFVLTFSFRGQSPGSSVGAPVS